MIRQILCLCVLVFSVSVFAAEGTYLALKPGSNDVEKPQGLWPLLGLGIGAMDHNDNSRTGGVPSHIKVLGSYYFSGPWVADVGLGLHNEMLTQKGLGSDSIQSLYSEFAGRYVFSNRWQLGAIWSTLVDNPHRYQSNNDNLASFAGIQALKEFSWDNHLVRVGGRAMTSVGLNGGPVNTVMAEVEMSFGDGERSASAAATPPVAEPTAVVAPLAPQLDTLAMRSFIPETKLPHFAGHSAHLTKTSKAYYRHLARALAQNHQLFEGVDVQGPKSKALAVAAPLKNAGVRGVQTVEGEASADDVYLQFRGVKDAAALRNVIDTVTR